jgi:hypothetical protein
VTLLEREAGAFDGDEVTMMTATSTPANTKDLAQSHDVHGGAVDAAQLLS